MKTKRFCSISDADDLTLMQLAAKLVREMEMRGLPDVSFKQGYKAGFLAALRDEDIGPGQVWEKKDVKELNKELERRFAA